MLFIFSVTGSHVQYHMSINVQFTISTCSHDHMVSTTCPVNHVNLFISVCSKYLDIKIFIDKYIHSLNYWNFYIVNIQIYSKIKRRIYSFSKSVYNLMPQTNLDNHSSKKNDIRYTLVHMTTCSVPHVHPSIHQTSPTPNGIASHAAAIHFLKVV